ncbi:pyridoxamine 5-phosphate oxidase [Octadecabacter sp. G9-8]|uniref:Pyridoxamine 5-phosphate oxidase n=1 Tax=Octadecabacter dasysiphoniae TaxID=2909341 RepID=A0ABS9CVQ8_9RHOB|nr:pyridoxamine 5-phosphate oxidase [Octadecabacter dasysiphoniae]MCF2870877.1 pyridoxamine 5-phosphate oxidase [Octadecabacter dasysiphoniae]
MTDPIRPTDAQARALAKSLLTQASYGALGVIDPDTNTPLVSRVAVSWIMGAPHILISDLSLHTKALSKNSACSLLIAELHSKGDPLTHPRITLQCDAKPADKATVRDTWLELHPKSKLYIDFSDFRVKRLQVRNAFLNGGFGRAFHLGPNDLT